ncbi:discoidin domain-containing protein [Pedobacter sp. KR3-3]|uniref:Discoidin domain-containing protein n=1 Tax=Pedobacter albus TaxID=3113905 RepID=A0ABU7I740_9SPHI|nr:discoidin domain-containing protein [Pedobacter sp. KR3-3]MEE1945287.1 discoidin domain-containing protein [Pedobacter sp. KR3-3]
MNKLSIAFLLALNFIAIKETVAQQTEWVKYDQKGKLSYKTTAKGDRIMDFSHAGYQGGGMPLPTIATAVKVKPSGTGDDTKTIQNAIDQVAKMPLKNGFRGAVELSPGVFTCANAIILSESGIVLRGNGSEKGGTTIKMIGEPHTAIVIGRGNTKVALGNTEDKEQLALASTRLADAYVPAGVSVFKVLDTKNFKVGDTIAIQRPVTDAWISFMKMDDMYREGKKQTWLGTGRQELSKRIIKAIGGNQITIDVPLADSYDAKFLEPMGANVVKLRILNRVTNVGVEGLHIQCAPLETDYGHAPYAAVRVGGDDCWVKNVFAEETMNSTVLAGDRITMQKVKIKHTYTNLGASKPADFSLEGSQNLIDRCEATGGNTYFVWTSSLVTGPNVVLNSTFRGIGSRIQPHQRWATGLLVDNCSIPDGNIDFMNRGIAGSGHGWTMAWAVAWNCVAKSYIIQNPPGAANWAIGCIGLREQTARLFDSAPIIPDGNFDSHGKPVAIQSLYLAQLEERLGNKALKNIGYQANQLSEFNNKKIAPTPFKPDSDPQLGINLAFERPVNTSNVRGTTRDFGGEKALDGNNKTYWTINDGLKQATFEVDMEGPVLINALKIGEALGQRVQEYKVEVQLDSKWILVDQGTSIGENKTVKFQPITAWKVKLTISKFSDYPAIKNFGLYLAK